MTETAESREKSSTASGVMDRITLRTQILISYSLMALVVCAISITLSLVMFDTLGTNVNEESSSIIVAQSLTNARDLAKAIVDAAGQELVILGDSVNKVSVEYSRILLTTTNSIRPTAKVPFKRLALFPSYPEFNFTAGCVESASCPADFGSLSQRSRYPGSANGSLAHSSVYLYSNANQAAVRNMSAWSNVFASSQALTDVRDAIAIQDEDRGVMFANNGSYLLYHYLAAKVTTKQSGLSSTLLSSYPGVAKNSSTYDPSARDWFKSARSDITHFYGPYVESFTNKGVTTLSVKQTFTYMNHTVEVVSAAAVDVESFRKLVTSFSYLYNGFAVVFNKQTNKVLAWNNRTDLVDAGTNSFKTVDGMDAHLHTNLCDESTFEFVDASGTTWLAGCADSYNVSVSFSNSDSIVGDALTVIVFAQKSLVMEQLEPMQNSVDDSGANITSQVLIVVLCSSFLVMLLVYGAVWNITKPLNTMRHAAQQVIEVMAEDEEVRDFAPVLDNAGFNVARTDEVGVLASDFRNVVCVMQNKLVHKRTTLKFPSNPWRLDCEEVDSTRLSTLTWLDLRGVVDASKQSALVPVVAVARPAATVDESTKVSARRSISKTLQTYRKKLSNKVTPRDEGQLEVITQPLSVGWLTSLKTQLSSLGALLLLSAVAAMLITIFTVENEGSTWSNDSADEVLNNQVTNLLTICIVKAIFVEAVFAQMSLDMMTSATALTTMLMGDFTTPTWEADGEYLYSYSLDPPNPYAINPNGKVYPFSSYFGVADAKCWTSSPHRCDVVRNDTLTRLTSLLDMKMESLIYPGSYLSYIQSAHESQFTRYWPMRRQTASYSVPTSCLANTKDIPLCANLFTTTKCGNASASSYPVYDPRCRNWYAIARANPTTITPTFLAPRLSLDGTYVLTGTINIANRTSGARMGVINLNFLINKLQASVSKTPIMTNGYSYLVDSQNVDTIILHPKQNLTCGTVKCVERMTTEEYAVFKSTVLQAGSSAKSTYVKDGATWRVATYPVRYGYVNYLLVGTVPDAEIVQFATEADDTIQRSSDEMIMGFVIAIAVVVVCMAFLIANIIRLIMKPLDDLRLVMQMALRKDFSKELPKRAGASDLTALMYAITQLLVALRLYSDSDSSADISRTHAVCIDSVNMFTAAGNRKGKGAALSNLAALELTMGNSSAAKEHFEQSIELAKELVSELEGGKRGGDNVEAQRPDEPDDLRRAKRVMSDRQGKLALTLTEQGDMAAAGKLFEQLLSEDKRNLYIRGCIEKQSTLGHVYLRQKQLDAAEKVFSSSLTLIRELQQSASVQNSALSEADAYEMLALCDLATLEEARHWRTSLEALQMLEHKFMAALLTPEHMEVSTVKRILRSLLALYGGHSQFADAKRLVQSIVEAHGMNLNAAAVEGIAVVKRVVFVMDFSSSMAGTKVRAMKDGMHAIMKEHVYERDSVAILSFNNSVQDVLPLTVKTKNNAMQIAKRVEALVAPVGGTALYDGISRALEVLKTGATSGDRIVLLSDGPDDKSKSSLEAMLRNLVVSGVSVVALGVGADAPESVLQRIAQATPHGLCVCGAAEKQDISYLFTEAARTLQSSRVVMEAF